MAAAQEDRRSYYKGGNDTDSDHEVSIHPRHWAGDKSIRFGSANGEESIGNDTAYRLHAVETAVRGINDKFDRLMSFLPTEHGQHRPRRFMAN